MPVTRSDAHKPSTAEPADYRQLGVFYQGSSEDTWDCYAADHRDLEEQVQEHFGQRYEFWYDPAIRSTHAPDFLFDGWFLGSRQCDCCGARFAHGAAYLHVPTNKVIHVGHDCASNLFSFEDRNAAVRSRAIAVAKERKKLTDTKAKFLADSPENSEAIDYLTERVESGPFSSFYSDVLAKFHKWGSLSEKQVAAVLKGKVRDAEKAAEPPEITAPVIEGRITVTGTVLTTKWQASDFGEQLKQLVRDDRGFKVWGTVPSVLYGVKRGDRVQFAAAVEKSKDDETFGYYKRPTKAIILEVAP